MPVYDIGEMLRVKIHGWSLLNQGENPEYPKPAETDIEPASEPEQEQAAPVEVVKRKPGRPRKV